LGSEGTAGSGCDDEEGDSVVILSMFLMFIIASSIGPGRWFGLGLRKMYDD
jgi:hypothetical protein